MAIAAELIQILNDLQVVTGLLTNLNGLTGQNATKADISALGNQVFVQLGLIQNQIIGLAAQDRQIWADLTRQIQGLGVQTGIPQQATQPVILPDQAPATFLDNTNAGTASAIWNYSDFRGLFTAFGALYDLYNLVQGLTQSAALPTIGPAHFVISGPIAGVAIVNWPLLALPSTDTILATDSDVGAWLNRTYPTFTWEFVSGQEIWRARVSGPPMFEVDCTLSQSEFLWFRLANSGRIPGANAAPVWPGLANVTYGAGQSMDAPNGSLGGPADGYRIVIDAVPSWAGTYSFGVTTSYRNVGAIAFVDDEGVPEFAQTLGLQTVHYLPKSMTHSVGAYYRLNIGYHCVAYPFVINS